MLFAPVTVIWFAFNTGVGFYNIFKYSPTVFRALSPHYGFAYLVRNGKLGWESLSGVLLCFTGTEALFADLGHLNRRSIQMAFLGYVYPSLIITYLGQAAFLTKHPEDVSETFYKALPGWTYWPGFVIATLAAIVASQALISAAFQIIKQAISAGFLPHFHIKQTSKKHSGQVYIPVVNWLLMILTIIIVTTFKTSIKIGRAYGLAVICDMLLTTHFMVLIMIVVWRKNLLAPIAFYAFFGAIELTFLSSALLKVPNGGWFSLLMSVIYAYIMLLWQWGSNRKNRYFAMTRQQLGDLFRVHRPKEEALAAKADKALARARGSLQLAASGVIIKRIPGIGIYYADSIYGAPHALAELVTRLPMLPELVIFLTNRFVPICEVLPKERFLVEQQGMPGFVHVVARYGYTERVVQGPAFVQALLESVMGLICRTLRITLVQSEILKAEAGQALSESAAAMVDAVGGDLYGKTHNSLLNADSSDPLSVCMTGIDTEMRRRRTRRPTIIGEDGQISWPTMGTAEEEEEAADDSAKAAAASARRQPRLTFPQEMQHFADKVSRVVAASDATAPLVQRAGDLAGDLALVANAAQTANITYVFGRSHISLKHQTRWNLLRTYLLEEPFRAFVINTGEPAHKTFGVPTDKLLEVGLMFDLSACKKELKRSD